MSFDLSEKKKPRVRKRHYIVEVLALFAFLTPILIHSLLQIGFSPVLTTSMEPRYMPGDLQITQPVSAMSLAVRDVIVLRDETSFEDFSHRIVSIEPRNGLLLVQTGGDNNPTIDQKTAEIPMSASIPKVISVVPKLGYVTNTFAMPEVRLALLLLLLGWAVVVAIGFARRKTRQSNGD